jgi:hypothetical protein
MGLFLRFSRSPTPGWRHIDNDRMVGIDEPNWLRRETFAVTAKNR